MASRCAVESRHQPWIDANEAVLNFAGWVLGAIIGGFVGALFLYEADIAWFEQGFTFGFMGIMGLWGLWYSRVSSLHPLYLRDNPGPGLIRLAFWLAMAWCVFTIFMFGSVKIVHIWYGFYLIIGFGVIHVFGLKGAELFGVRLRIDVYERKNFSAAMFIAAFMLATGLIYGGSMWGESEAESLEYGGIFEVLPSYDDGWWIIILFFLMGWTILFLTMKLWFFREKGVSGSGIRRDRAAADGRAAALYCLACAIPITDAVSGDYYGLGDSIIGFSAIALPVLAHEVFRPSSPEQQRDPQEPWYYIAFGFAAMLVSPFISSLLGFR